VGLPLALQSDRLVISHRLDPRTLSDYTYAAQLYTPLWSVVSVAAASLWPIFATRASGEAGLRRSWLTSVRLLGLAGAGLAVAYLLLANVIIAFMSAGTAHAPLSLLVSFAALLVVQSLHVGTGMLLISPRQLRFQAACVLALVITNIPLSWVLAPVMGGSGPVVASAVTVTACQLVPGLIAGSRWTSPARGE
jgi:O-antigen/teichoic acid export membrane protein